MQKTTIEIGGLIAILDFLAIEKRLRAVPGIETVAMNAGSSTATVTFDEAVTSVAAIVHQVEACGFHCRGESVPRHVCAPDSTVISPGHPKAPSAIHAAHARHGAAATMLSHDAMAHEMGHLLLPHGAHSVAGLMRAEWDRAQVRNAATGLLTFTPDQASLIRERLRASASPIAHVR